MPNQTIKALRELTAGTIGVLILKNPITPGTFGAGCLDLRTDEVTDKHVEGLPDT